MKLKISKNKHSHTGASLVEMALLIALIAMIAIPSVSWMGESVDQKLEYVHEHLTGEGTIQCGDPPLPPC